MIKDPNLFTGDIWKVDYKNIPNFDILCGGFPCQPFSNAGNRLGFKDNKQGNLFFRIAEIVEVKKPKVVFLEKIIQLIKDFLQKLIFLTKKITVKVY